MKKRIPAYNSKRPSPYSGIVHHLSGRNRHALTHILPQRDLGTVDDAPPARRGSRHSGPEAPPSPSLRPRVCHPETRTHVALLGPCFKTGRMRPFGYQRPRMIPPDKPTFAVKSEYHEISASNLLDDSFSSISDLDTSVGME